MPYDFNFQTDSSSLFHSTCLLISYAALPPNNVTFWVKSRESGWFNNI